jgi:diaminopimelate decarboxylase
MRLDLFPLTAAISATNNGERLTIAGCDLEQLAAHFGTPLYLYDQDTLDDAAASYLAALKEYYPGESAVTFAGKAHLSIAMAQWTQCCGLWLDCTGAGELHIAQAAGVPRERILMHGVNKNDEDLRAAIAHAAIVVVDNLSELRKLVSIMAERSRSMREPALWVRVRPGVAVDTHAYRQTGQEESKFGMGLSEAMQAVEFCRKHGLKLEGIHFHQGSHFHDAAPIGLALRVVLDFVCTLREQTGWLSEVLCPGGGWGVPYHEDDLPHPPIEEYVRFVAQELTAGCAQRGLPLPRLQLEPGRSLVARAGVALYRVGAVKQTAQRRWLLVDGGMADNPRPSLYGARYSALPVSAPNRPFASRVNIAGPFCESGDILIHDLPMPEITEGELLAVPVSGAYHLAMGSNYNGARRPAVVWLREGRAHLVQQRESLESLTSRDLPLPKE